MSGAGRRAAGFVGALLFVAAVALAAWLLDRPVKGIEGAARVIDGDSIVVAGVEIRVFGIDAPEYRQTCTRRAQLWECGREAASVMRAMVEGKRLTCRAREQDRYGRTVATCTLGEEDIAARMVRDGYALAYGAYQSEEQAARAARRGLWASTFETPAQWRAQHPRGKRAGGSP